MTKDSSRPLAEVTRGVMEGGRVESVHHGRAVVVDAGGAVLWAQGDVEAAVFPRSTVKPLLALELVESGAADRIGLDTEALALACASHGGEEAHARVASAMLAQAGRGVETLECGAHEPLYEPAARALAWAHREACPLHNNCSGKHAGLICLAVDRGVDPAGYVEPSHEIQRAVTDVLAQVTGTPHTEANRGIDGCSIPTYAIPLRALAHGFARFGSGAGLAPSRAEAARRLREAVAAHPFLIAGTGRYDTEVARVFGERLFVKMGAEGVMAAAVPCLGIGIAIKVDDGANRAAEVAMSALLRRFGGGALADAEGAAFLDGATHRTLRNWRGTAVGEIRASRM